MKAIRYLASALAGTLLAASAINSGFAADYRIAFLAASSQNGFNHAVFEGMLEQAKALGNVEVDILDGEFNATKQYTQVEDVTASGTYQGLVILPNDSVGVAAAIADAAKTLNVATVLFPIGPKLDDLNPQVPGLVTTVASNPAVGAKAAAEGVVEYCKDKNPCNVVTMIGLKIQPSDNLRLQTYIDTLTPHDNIKIVASVEGQYDPDKAMAAMQDVLQAHKDINVVLSNADQHLVGVEIALKDAGIEPGSIYLSGGGANQIAVEAIREGRWSASLADFPRSMGALALKNIVESLEGKTVPLYTDSNTIGKVPALITKKVLDEHPDFKAEWEG
jgi:ribose transport system substrate-binding protein